MKNTFYNTLAPLQQSIYDLAYTPALDTSKSILFTGPSGSGKTTASLLLAKKYESELKLAYPHMESGAVISFLPFITFIFDARRAMVRGDDDGWQARRLLEFYQQVPLLILDDIGATKATDFVDEQFYLLLEHRLNNKLVTYFTSQRSLENIKTTFQSNIARRIIDITQSNTLELKSSKWIGLIPAPVVKDIVEVEKVVVTAPAPENNERNLLLFLEGIRRTNPGLAKDIEERLDGVNSLSQAISTVLKRRAKTII